MNVIVSPAPSILHHLYVDSVPRSKVTCKVSVIFTITKSLIDEKI